MLSRKTFADPNLLLSVALSCPRYLLEHDALCFGRVDHGKHYTCLFLITQSMTRTNSANPMSRLWQRSLEITTNSPGYLLG